VSFHLCQAVGAYVLSRLRPPITCRIGNPEEVYLDLGKGENNLEKLSVFVDTLESFDGPTSDSNRAGITTAFQEILMSIIAFAAIEEMHPVWHRPPNCWYGMRRHSAVKRQRWFKRREGP
jgi:hypothetical protein